MGQDEERWRKYTQENKEERERYVQVGEDEEEIEENTEEDKRRDREIGASGRG